MVTVVSPNLLAAGAAWDDGPGAGDWIADRLGPFGPSVGHAVPLGYEAYAVVPIPAPLEHADEARRRERVPDVIDAPLAVLSPFTGDQSVHFGMWEGWSWWYDTGAANGLRVGVYWDQRDGPTSQAEIDRERAAVRERLAAELVERPDAMPLALPERRYYLWSGPLRSATAFRHEPQDPPSLIWPDDRSWFAGVPIYTDEIALAGSTGLIDAVLAEPRLSARPAAPDGVLAGDD